MLLRGGVDRIDGADPDRVSGSMPRPALGSGGADRGIPTAGVRVGIPAGAQIHGVTSATGTAADAPPAAYRLVHRPSRRLKQGRHQYCIGNGINPAPVEKGMPKSDWSFVAVAVAVSMATASVPWLFLIKW
jgi:hypothetical protein